jgi:hypothetical protein
MRRKLRGMIVASAMMAACGESYPCECPPRDPAAGHAFDTAAFDFTQQDDAGARRGGVETDPTQVLITYQTDDGRMFRAVYGCSAPSMRSAGSR